MAPPNIGRRGAVRRLEGVLLALIQAVLATARIILTGRLVRKTEPIVLATQMLIGASVVATAVKLVNFKP